MDLPHHNNHHSKRRQQTVSGEDYTTKWGSNHEPNQRVCPWLYENKRQ